MLIESEARKKWCPQTQRDPSGSIKASSLCIGSNCVAWRPQPGTDVGACLMMRAVGAPSPTRVEDMPVRAATSTPEIEAPAPTRRGKATEL